MLIDGDNMEKSNKTSERLQLAMKIKGVTQADLRRLTGINKGAISCYVSGKYIPKQNGINLLSNALQVDPLWLLGYDTYMEKVGVEAKEKDAEFDLLITQFRNLKDKQKELIKYMFKLFDLENKK